MNIGVITQARTTSTRLPAKILLKANNLTLIEHHLERLFVSNIPVFVATTTNKEDNLLSEICTKQGVKFFRGDEQNVLSRFYECALLYNLDIIVRVTSDCPFIDTQLIHNGLKIYLQEYKKNKNIYLSNTLTRTFPKGLDFEIFSFDMLKEANQKAQSNREREHVTPYFYENMAGKNIKLINFSNVQNTSNLRITLDFLDDYTFIKTLIEVHKAHKLSYIAIESLIQNTPELMHLNNLCRQVASNPS